MHMNGTNRRAAASGSIAVPLCEGTFSVGSDKRFNRIGRNEPPQKGALKLSINPFLIRGDERNFLFDAGLGEFGEQTSVGTITGNLERQGLQREDITDIFLSHLHYDHFGSLATFESGYPKLTFPSARLWVSGRAWEKMRSLDGATKDEQKRRLFHFLDTYADLRLLDTEEQPYPEIRVREIGGHTEHSQLLFYESGNHRYMMAGDVIGRMSSVKRKYTVKFDFDPERSMRMREELKCLAWEEKYVIMAYHETEFPLFRIADHDSKLGYLTDTNGLPTGERPA